MMGKYHKEGGEREGEERWGEENRKEIRLS